MVWDSKKAIEAAFFVLAMGIVITVGTSRKAGVRTDSIPRPTSVAERTTRLYEESRPPLPIPKTVGRACREVWNGLRALDLAEFVEYPPRPGLVPSAYGCSPPNAELLRAQTEYDRVCRPLARWKSSRPQSEWHQATRLCASAVISYRAAVTDFLTRGRAVASISDVRVLTDKLIATLGEDRADGVAVAERLLQLEPQMYPAAKAVLVSLLDDAVTRAVGKNDDPVWEKVEQALRRAQALEGAERKQLLETELAIAWMRTRDARSLRAKAEAMGVSHPELGVGPYYQAWAAYSEGDRTRAAALLTEAIRREPKQRHFQEALEKLGDRGEVPFRTYLSFGFDK